MLDIVDKLGKVVAVIMDDGTVVRKMQATDDIDTLIKEQLNKGKKRKK